MSITPSPAESQPHQTPRQVYERLAAASPAEKAEVVLRLIEGHPHGRLELPARDGLRAVLDEVDLSRPALEARGGQAVGPAPWWDAERQGACLRGADLRGAGLTLANLPAADLAEADLRQTCLRGAKLQGARLEEADLRGADLAGADLRGAALGGADLGGAMLEDALLQDASLRFVNAAGAALEAADLRGADLWGARLEGAVLTKADLQKAILTEADLQRADLTGADLRGAVLARANFTGAVLRDAHLEGAVLFDCNLTHVHVCGAAIDKAQFRREQLGGAIGEELAGEFEDARRAYLALERHFTVLGDADAASWAYRKRRRMQKLAARQQARAALARRDWRAAAAWYAKYGGDQLTEWLSDYGESVPRVLGCLLGVYLFFLLFYSVAGGVVRVAPTANGLSPTPTRSPADLAVFTLFAMTTTMHPPAGLLPADDFTRLATGVQALLGTALIGLLGFVMGSRMRR